MGGLTVTDGMIKLNEPVARVDDDQTQGQPDCSVAVLHGRVQQEDEDGALRGHVITLEVQRRWARLGWVGDHARTTGEEGRKKCPAGLILHSPVLYWFV